MTRRRLPIVTEATFDRIDIATPCAADWNQMQGDDRVRHCSDCRLNVYDISQMTRAEAATLIATNESGRTCLRLYRRPDGTLLTQDCWARLRAARQRGWVAFAAALVIVGLTQLGLRFAALGWLIQWNADRRPTEIAAPVATPVVPVVAPVVTPPPVDEPRHVMGEMAAMPPPPVVKKPARKPRPASPPVPPEHVLMGKMVMPSDDR